MQVVLSLKLQIKTLSPCTKGSAIVQIIDKPRVKQLSDHTLSVLTLSNSSPHIYLSLLASMELHGLERVLSSGLSRVSSAQLSLRKQGRKLFMQRRDKRTPQAIWHTGQQEVKAMSLGRVILEFGLSS